MADYLTINRIREFVVDENPEDNPLGADLMWSDHDILAAMRSAASAYNRIEPQVEVVDGSKLPDDRTDIFLNGVAAELYRRSVARLRRRDIDYSAGEVQASVVKSQLRNFEKAAEEHSRQFMEGAQARKITINISHAWGHFS